MAVAGDSEARSRPQSVAPRRLRGPPPPSSLAPPPARTLPVPFLSHRVLGAPLVRLRSLVVSVGRHTAMLRGDAEHVVTDKRA